MVKIKPEMIWVIRHRPSSDPKFHHILMLFGVGSMIKEERIFKKGGNFMIGGFISISRYSLKNINFGD